LIAVLLIAAGVVIYFKLQKPEPAPKRPGGPTTALGQGLEKGTERDCQNNLQQIRYAITMQRDQGGEMGPPPATLQSLQSQGIGPQMLKCPVTQQPYQYNPQTGVVWCPTPGHEKY
jgi:hypothetical protein